MLKKHRLKKGQKGFTIAEMMIVVLVIAILVVLALPQLISSRRAFRFSGLQRQVAATLTETRQEAISQVKPVTFRYDDTSKKINIYGGKFGASGDTRNRIVELTGSGLESDEIGYGRPSDALPAALGDTSNITPLASNAVTITFESDGSVLDAGKNPQNNAVFFYDVNYPSDMAFAVSVLGAGGRVKVWRYNKNIQLYVE